MTDDVSSNGLAARVSVEMLKGFAGVSTTAHLVLLDAVEVDEGREACDHLVEQHAQRPPVDALVVPLAQDHLVCGGVAWRGMAWRGEVVVRVW